MADTKISGLPASTTPLAGTEVLPIVQSGATKKVSVANLTAGRAVAMAGGSFTDNITQSTAAKGINFTANTPAAGMTNQLLNWYEEGTWTPTQGAGLTVVGAFSSAGKYTRIGKQVTIVAEISAATSVAVSAGGVLCAGLPFATPGGTAAVFMGSLTNNNVNVTSAIAGSGSTLYATSAVAATPRMYFSASYLTS